LVAAVTKPDGATADNFVVVINAEGQQALWQAELGLPSGWQRTSAVLSASECLAAIDESWPDVTPASVRRGPPPGAPGGGLVHDLFAERASRHPDAPAVVAGRARLSYRELDASASQLASHLSEAGVAPETMVGVCLERGVDMIRAILAVMKAGGGYLALDPSLPPDRLAQICTQVRPAVVITERAAPFPGAGARLLRPSDVAAEPGRRPAATPATAPHPGNICYAIYTSGSTGDPKAVAVSYGSLASVIGSIADEYQIGANDRVAQVASPAFDTSLEQVFAALTRGAVLLLPPPGTVAPSELLRGIGRKQVTVIDLTPAYWHQMLAHTAAGDARLRSVRLMITGGEMADPADCRAALRAAPWARLLNAYGLTETTITSALCDIGGWLSTASQEAREAREAIVPVGKPVGDARIMVLDEKLRPMPAGATGEVYIGGPGVARGYLGRPALTAQRFLPDEGGEPGARMYRTGDRGRWLDDGNLEVTGRMDRQLKVRGFRVEPAEIESVLAGHPDIDQVSVVAGPRGSGDTRLVAYYTPSRGAATGTIAHHPPATSLRRYLLDRLPGYMIPAAFVPRQHPPSVPGDGSGPEHGERPPRPAARGEQPHTPAQAGLSALWAGLLRREHVGLDDDFFALGGNSLLAAEMLAHTGAIFGVSPDSVRPLTRSLLRDPTLRGFSAAVQDARAGKLASAGDQPEADFAREAQLDLTIQRDGAPWRPRPDWRDPREILLTGATGFLGAHLLSELLAATSARIWCLVRAGNQADALERIARTAARYELGAPPPGRVVPLPGDLAEPWLGLPDVAFRDLARDVDIIYHAGALVNFIYPYQELRAANVAGTREVVRLAGLYRGIPVHYVSTTAVLAGLGVAGVREVTEETALAWPERLRMGYVETKYVAEELLRAAGRAGLPVAVYRPLDIVGSLATGVWSTSTEMAAMIRFVTDTGLAPDIDLPLDFVPADVCAAAIRRISVSGEATGRTYHLASPRQALLSSLVGRLRDHGYPVSRIPFADWVNELARQAARDPSHPMAAFLPLFVDRDSASGLTVAEMYLEHVFPAYSRSNTVRALRGSGISFPPVSGQLLDRNLDRLMETGYLPAPPGRPRRADDG
jgi:amino acid adenylation domain-containing protein/thioester reductase-like protein